MKLMRIFTGEDGRSHFQEMRIPTHDAMYGQDSAFMPALGFVFREAPIGGSFDFHNAPRRTLAIQLTGLVEVRCGDGSSFRLGPGDVLLAEDTSGEGHIVREIEGPRYAVNVALPDDLDLSGWS